MGSIVSYLTRRGISWSSWNNLDDDSVNSETGFSVRQQKIIRETWDSNVKNDLIGVGVETMLRLFDRHPEIKQIFGGFKNMSNEQLKENKRFHAHCLSIMNVINSALEAFLSNDIDLFVAILTLNGERHARLSKGITDKHFECVKTPLLETLKYRMQSNRNYCSQNEDWILGLWSQAVDKMIQTINNGLNDYKPEI